MKFVSFCMVFYCVLGCVVGTQQHEHERVILEWNPAAFTFEVRHVSESDAPPCVCPLQSVTCECDSNGVYVEEPEASVVAYQPSVVVVDHRPSLFWMVLQALVVKVVLWLL